jgi:hypothetical protein
MAMDLGKHWVSSISSSISYFVQDFCMIFAFHNFPNDFSGPISHHRADRSLILTILRPVSSPVAVY